MCIFLYKGHQTSSAFLSNNSILSSPSKIKKVITAFCAVQAKEIWQFFSLMYLFKIFYFFIDNFSPLSLLAEYY